MALPALLAPVVAFLLRDIVLKFVVLGSVFVLVGVLMPIVFQLAASWLAPQQFNEALARIPPEVWFFWDVFRFDFGISITISAYITRFSIRRLPVVG